MQPCVLIVSFDTADQLGEEDEVFVFTSIQFEQIRTTLLLTVPMNG